MRGTNSLFGLAFVLLVGYRLPSALCVEHADLITVVCTVSCVQYWWHLPDGKIEGDSLLKLLPPIMLIYDLRDHLYEITWTTKLWHLQYAHPFSSSVSSRWFSKCSTRIQSKYDEFEGMLKISWNFVPKRTFKETKWTLRLRAMDRAHRIGQKKVVNVYRLISRGTLEEKIMGLQKFKLSIANTIITQDNSSLHSMDTSQLLDLFSVEENKSSKREESNQVNKKESLKTVLEDLGELWDEKQYENEYNLDNFMQSLS
eukprot:gene9220-10194_t